MIYVTIPTKKNQFYIQINEQTKKKQRGKHKNQQASIQKNKQALKSKKQSFGQTGTYLALS